MPNVKTGDPAVDTFLKGYSPQVREIAVKARETILSVMPKATEKVYPGWKVIQYGTGTDMKSVFAVISPQRERVSLSVRRHRSARRGFACVAHPVLSDPSRSGILP